MKEARDQKATAGYNAATGTSSKGWDRAPNRFAGNQHQTTNPDAMINKGRGPTVGNKSSKSTPGTDSMPNHNPGREYITGGAQVRTPGGTRAWDPKAGQNYKGNPDSINVGRGPTKGNQL